MILDVLEVSLLISGSFILLLSAFGVMRLPDIFCRLHALAKSMPLGINLMLIAAWIHLGHDSAGLKIFLAIVFQVISIPVSGHLVALIAFKKRSPRWKQKAINYH